ncbi:MAG: bifunctional UDP-N-acetylglucosamine diphosphorylase/glucosamine-1-phosphate N-acetyltransferase GlmU [Reyranella sp.]|jgi:bifunctional UDP-N-acetylglucosamine pyrophosphorylase/glucosamine-1-phosphate N-acetyltransferase|uniref:bifunctional UDP-N-acetylglucosamine diphosphorylase/glucosamine-1-phosphate N-acetyltransferase GlmU n=1 Tax=Reyranella sp. TaxID=1929291 RepID=UPI001AC5EA7F|nr:bifunctional UDP-N-acetylglucosamine diphosphorylase/glucosamine-1-phosphate N-acetyltransferase GlmU [Reyranella sp.]MBN9537576.1 bifunctional UDP-N-acetylglucosamine diphosphorylase/glucosamine-1-phosphate N-acetyltransferase GlmU [Alphaproteobacteria bacterium]MBR2819332.1 bifunctional UDP-N-acetylglucosamine diphosphorylase/glucosamine-1-phosphate N-acetyltransferase GlmU [Reyranella sp.]
MKPPIAVVVLAAGAGTRMKSALPKVLHPLANRAMVHHVLDNVAALKPARVVGVVAPGAKNVAAAFGPHPTVVQKKPLGTGHAAKAALGALGGHKGPVLVVFGDAPLVTSVSLQRLVSACAQEKAAVGVLGFVARDPSPYGRLIVQRGILEKIVESKDADEIQKTVDFCNSGVMCLDGRLIAGLLAGIKNNNVKREFYLTDAVALARAAGHKAIAVAGDEAEFQGINSRAELAAAEYALQQRLRAAAMAAGVTMVAPETVWLSADTRLASDVTIGPNVRFGPGVEIASDVEIKAFCDIEGARIGRGAIVGPFARIRPGSDVAENVHIGNFVELKATRMGRGAKANHLAYLGDADIGAASNIGAGTIAVNYDGFGKWRTVVADDVFIGSNSSLVAPVHIGKGANVTAGSVVTEDVPAGGLAFGRARQVTKKGRAAPLRAKLKARAAAAKRAKKK